MSRRAASPLSILLPYQADWVHDDARFKIGCWSRQTGKSFSTAAEAVADCLARKTTWVTLSAGERQALEWMLKAREWAEAFKVSLAGYEELRDTGEALLKSAEITWPNGSRLIAIPANPSTARGYSANLTLDEFAFHENPDAIWRAIYPSISNPLKGVFKIRVVSTPNGQGNKFHALWSSGKNWSRHLITIHEAVKRGLPLNVEELREGLSDPDGWAQEYECEFMDSAAVLLPYDLIASVETPNASDVVPPEYWLTPGPAPVVLGIDFGRRRDFTVCWAAEQVGNVLVTREVAAFTNLDTPAQLELLTPRISKARRVAFDYTGPGVGLGDYLVKHFGEWNPAKHQFGKIELVNFTNELKCEIFPKLRMACERKEVFVPARREIREDLHSVHRTATKTGKITYGAPHTPDGHADRCTALALCVRAGAEIASPPTLPVANLNSRLAGIRATRRERRIG